MKKKLRLFRLMGVVLLVATMGCGPQPGPWHPELVHRPRVLYKASQEARIRHRLSRAPYDGIYGRVVNRANQAYEFSDPTGGYDQGNELKNANIAKAAAFVYAMEGGEIYAQKAAELLLHLDPNVDTAYNTDLYASQALTCYCQAFDTLLGTGYGTEPEREAMAALLGGLADSLYSQWILGNHTFFNFWMNNHQTKVASAMGMAAITLNQDGRATEWINYGVTVTDLILNRIQSPPGGGCGEGTNYYQYSAESHLPFMWALHRFLDGGGETFYLRVGGPFFLLRAYIPGYYESFLNMAEVRHTIDWLIKLRLPDGRSPNFDDANLTYRYNGMFAGLWEEGMYAWDWLEGSRPYNTSGSVDMGADLLCTYDDSITPRPPVWPSTQFLVDAGNAVFRSDWSSDATYLLLLGEHGIARTSGFGHEHPDATSFILYHGGEILALDSGYINWEHHHMVNQAKNHNLVLIDGEGPPNVEILEEQLVAGVDAFIEDVMDTDFVDFCRVRTAYAGAGVIRSLLFVCQDHFFIVDDLRSPGQRNYEWLLHGNDLDTFQVEATGGTWHRPAAQLTAFVTSTQGRPTFGWYPDVHATNWGDWDEHAVLEASIQADRVRFLSLLYPSRTGEIVPPIRELSTGGEQAALKLDREDGLEVLYTTQGQGGTVTVPLEAAGLDPASTDAEILFVKVEPGTTTLDQVFLKAGTVFTYVDRELFSAPAGCDLAVSYSTGRVHGFVRPTGSDRFDLYTAGEPATVTGSGVTGYLYPGEGTTRIFISGPTDFLVQFAVVP